MSVLRFQDDIKMLKFVINYTIELKWAVGKINRLISNNEHNLCVWDVRKINMSTWRLAPKQRCAMWPRAGRRRHVDNINHNKMLISHSEPHGRSWCSHLVSCNRSIAIMRIANFYFSNIYYHVVGLALMKKIFTARYYCLSSTEKLVFLSKVNITNDIYISMNCIDRS